MTEKTRSRLTLKMMALGVALVVFLLWASAMVFTADTNAPAGALMTDFYTLFDAFIMVAFWGGLGFASFRLFRHLGRSHRLV